MCYINNYTGVFARWSPLNHNVFRFLLSLLHESQLAEIYVIINSFDILDAYIR